MISFDSPRLLISIVLNSELNHTSSQYDHIKAGSSDEDARLIWILWSATSFTVALFCLTLFFGIISSPKARKSAFNVYILFMVLPDIAFNICCCITCALNASAGHYFSVSVCQWQSWYSVFTFTASSSMNAAVALELQRLLRDCKSASHYQPPPIKKVLRRCFFVYLYSSFVASLTFFGLVPPKTDLAGGFICLPVEYDTVNIYIFWFLFMPAVFGIPFVIFLYVCWDIYRQKLLPSNSRTRQLRIFLMRIALVFGLMFVLIVLRILTSTMSSMQFNLLFGFFSHLVGLASAAFCLGKEDVRSAVVNFICCKSHDLDLDEDRTWIGRALRRSISRRASSFMSRRRSSRLHDVYCKDISAIMRNKNGDSAEMSSADDPTTSVTSCSVPEMNNKPIIPDIEQPGIDESSEGEAKADQDEEKVTKKEVVIRFGEMATEEKNDDPVWTMRTDSSKRIRYDDTLEDLSRMAFQNISTLDRINSP